MNIFLFVFLCFHLIFIQNYFHYLIGRVYNDFMGNVKKQHSLTTQLLLALVPYTRQNLLLTFKPNQFFNELERTSRQPVVTIRTTYKRAVRRGLVQVTNNQVKFSLQARQTVQQFIAPTLPSGAQLMVIFDIPESMAHLRQKFRRVLRLLGFRQVQQSVWLTDKDHREILAETIDELGINDYAQLYEAAQLTTKK